MDDKKCTLEDIEAIIPAWNRWSVNNKGYPVSQISQGYDDGSWDTVEEYVCDKCDTYFTPKKDELALSVWDDVLEHVGGKEKV